MDLELAQTSPEWLDEDTWQFADQISHATAASVREIFMGVAEEISGDGEEEAIDDADEVDGIDPLDSVAAYLDEDGWSWQRQEDGDS